MKYDWSKEHLQSTVNQANCWFNRILNNHPHCELCGIEDWCGKPLSFQLHHIDGNNKNNSVDNLQLLCPNCHSQTDTYSNKKR